MRHVRLSRRAGLGIVALAAVVIPLAVIAQTRLEREVRLRVERAAGRSGLVVQVDGVHVGVWPPVVLTGVRVRRPGVVALSTDSIGFTPRLWGQGLLGRARVTVGPVTAAGPAGLAVAVAPTRWDLFAAPAGGLRVALRSPTGAFQATSTSAAGEMRLEASVAGIPASRLITLQRDGEPLLDAGVVDGTLRLSHTKAATTFDLDLGSRGLRVRTFASSDLEPTGAALGEPTDLVLRLSGSWQPDERSLRVPRWSVTAEGVAVSGSLTFVDPHLDLSFEVERVEMARLLRTSGVGSPEAAGENLGAASLSAQITGTLADPSSFKVSQKLDFTPPPRPPPALAKLRGDFVHEVEGPGAARTSVVVGPASPDFIPLDLVPPLFLRALLLAEDSGFYGHRGMDLGEVPSAIAHNWARRGPPRGASTITQQLAKNLFLSRERRLGRKLQELCLALLLESTLSKERILEIYLNVIEWGPNLYGLRPAARHYFAKEPAELTPAEAALLVALIPGPLKYQRSLAQGVPSPGFRPLVDQLLAKLRSVDAITEEEYQRALADELLLAQAP